MLNWHKTRAESRRKASELYGAIVTQARQKAFYTELGIPDTPAGRYEMIVIHLFMALERLSAEGGAGRTPARNLVEAFVADMDDSLREMGTGDMSVPKKVRRAAAGLYERSRAYRAALAANDSMALARALAAHALEETATDRRSSALAAYVEKAMANLAAQDAGDVLSGRIAFPAVDVCKEGVR